MTGCHACGTLLRPDTRFCGQCGEAARVPAPTVITPVPPPVHRPPLPTARRSPLPVVGAVAVVVLLVAGVVGGSWWLFGRDDTASAAPPSPTPRVVVPTTVHRAPNRTEAPADALASWVRQDRAQAESLVGYWVPQISAKQAGLQVGTTTYTDALILSEYLQARSTEGAILVRSQDYSTFQRPGFWITLIPRGYTSAVQANAWCDAQSLGPDDCFAKKLSHTEGSAGSTVHR